MSTSNKIVLTSSDGESFEIDEAVARKLQIIAHMIDDDCAGKAIPLANVTGKILALVIEYCKIHVNDKDPSEETDEIVSSDDKESPKEANENVSLSDSTKETNENVSPDPADVKDSSKETNENVSSYPNEESEENKEAKEEELMTNWDAEFMKRCDLETTFLLILAANYLNVKGLLALTSQTVADYIKDKNVEEVREIFNIENDFTPEEEEQIRKENLWAFET
ncbi:hypothetical protein CARUB_v10019386mg [Capsella rubella]|uniref:SKP1-like protein n=1 Tax=Capsella rubella TaxID=81985 RepID=R0HE65_9BRAS|nr:SKP1-like protein 18 [Capsella rubella]EOA23335.1 hypothetical protein CARUB_v10019386mg [Capsella rubella]